MGTRAGALAGIAIVMFTARARARAETDPVTGVGGADRVDGDEAPGLVAFTFDDGPRAGTTEQVLDALAAYDVPATFFVVGHRLSGKHNEAARALLARMHAEGYLIGNHTFSHVRLPTLADGKATWQIDQTSKTIASLLGGPVGLFRAPYGELSRRASAHVRKQGMTTVDWSIDSRDWQKPRADKMRRSIIDGIVRENGGVVLMHDTKPITAKTIASILDALEATNCERLAAGEEPIVPVSLHYFLRDDGKPREVPADVEARTQRYRDALPGRCESRKAADG